MQLITLFKSMYYWSILNSYRRFSWNYPDVINKENTRKLYPTCFGHQIGNLKGTVSPDLAFYFRIYTFKPVLSVRPLMVFKFVYFIVLYEFENPFDKPLMRLKV